MQLEASGKAIYFRTLKVSTAVTVTAAVVGFTIITE